MTKKEIMTDNLKDLTKEKSFNNILCEGLKLLKPSRSRIIFMLIILVIIIFPVFNIAFKKNTLEEFLSIIELSNDVIKDLFGIIFTGYALFQALVGANLLKQMLISKIGKNSDFKTYNLYFFIISIMYLFIILLNFILIITLKNIDYSCIKNINVTIINILAFIFIIVYIEINVFAIFETKSFVVNIYHCFNISALSEGIDMLKDDIEKSNDKNDKNDK